MPDRGPAQQPSAQRPIALLGTGIMGAGWAAACSGSAAGAAWNRTPATARALEPAGATIAATPADAVKDASVIVTMLSDGDAVLETMSAAVPGLRAGQLWVQASTVGVAGLEPLTAAA
jgi:3-hydroxyisobutyrate dehydrogenase